MVASMAWRCVEAARWQRFGAIGLQREAPLCLRVPDAAAVKIPPRDEKDLS